MRINDTEVPGDNLTLPLILGEEHVMDQSFAVVRDKLKAKWSSIVAQEKVPNCIRQIEHFKRLGKTGIYALNEKERMRVDLRSDGTYYLGEGYKRVLALALLGEAEIEVSAHYPDARTV